MASGVLFAKLVGIASFFVAVAAVAFRDAVRSDGSMWQQLLHGGAGVLLLGLGGIFFVISFMRTSPHQDVMSTLRQLAVSTRMYLIGQRQMRLLRSSWKNIRQSQERLLLYILRENENTVHGRHHRLAEIRSMDEFRQRFPLTSYEHYRAYVDRAMAGEDNVMTRTRPTSFVQTTGTTGKCKFIPHIMRHQLIYDMFARGLATASENRPKLGLLQKQFLLYVAPEERKAESGAQLSSFLTLAVQTDNTSILYSTPSAGFGIGTLKDACYVHSLFALREPSIGIVFSFFIHFLESMIKLLEHHWRDIVHDIEHGTIHESVVIEPAARAELVRALGGGDPRRAREVRGEFERGFDGFMKRVWPDLQVVIGIDNTKVWPALKKKYAQGLSLLPFVYGSSEAIIGHASWLQEERKGYSLISTELVYEFIKFDDTEQSQPKTFLPDELEIGGRYEVVISQVSGLYRYRMGDIIRVVEYHGGSPIMEFMYRLGTMLNLRFEKLHQVTVVESLAAAVGRWPGLKLKEYAAAQSDLIPEDNPAFEKEELMPYYIFFLELEHVGRPENESVSEEEKAMVNEELSKRNSDITKLRNAGSIANPRVHVVKPGTFDQLKEHVITHTGASANQYKVPLKLRTVPSFNVLFQNIKS